MPIHDYYFQRDQLFALPPFLVELQPGEQISAIAGRRCTLFVGTSHGNISCWDLTNIHSMMAAATSDAVRAEPVLRIFSLQLPGKVSQLSVSLEGKLLLAISDGFLYSINTETIQIVSRSVNGDGLLVCSSHTSLQLPDEQQPQRLDIVFFACKSGLSILSLPTLAALRFVPNLQLHSICECFGGVAATTESMIVHVSHNGTVQKLCRIGQSQGAVYASPGAPISFIPDSDEIVFAANDGGIWCCNVDVLCAPRQYQQPHFVFSPLGVFPLPVGTDSPSLVTSKGLRASSSNMKLDVSNPQKTAAATRESAPALMYSGLEVCGQFCTLLGSNGLVFTDLLRCSILKEVSLPSCCMCMCMLDIGFIVASPDQLVAVLGDQHPAQESRSSMFTEAKLSLQHIKVNIECTLPNNQKMNQLVALDMTIAQMIEVFFKSAGLPESEQFVLKFRSSEYPNDHITWNTDIVLHESPMVQFCLQPRKQRKLAFSAVRRTTTLEKEIALSKRKAEERLRHLVGKHVLRTPEVIFFESKCEQLWQRILTERRKEMRVERLQRHYPQTPLLMHLPSDIEQPIDIKVAINMLGFNFKVFRMMAHNKPSVLLQKILAFIGKSDMYSDDMQHFVLKLTGTHEFLLSDVPLVCIRCVALQDPSRPISVTLVKVSQSVGRNVDDAIAAMSISASVEDTPPPVHHQQHASRPENDFVCIDIYDVCNSLRVRVCSMERLDMLADEQRVHNESNLKELEKQKRGHGRKLDVLRDNELLSFLLKENDALLWVRLELFSGDSLLCPAVATRPVLVTAEQSDCVRFDEWKDLDLQTCFIPLGSRMCVSLMYCSASKFQAADGPGVRCIGWVNQHMFDNNDIMAAGAAQLRLWQNNDVTPINPMSMPYDNPRGNAGQIFLEFPRRLLDVVFSGSQQSKSKLSAMANSSQRLFYLQIPLSDEPISADMFEYSTLRLRPPIDHSDSIQWSTLAADGFDPVGLSPDCLERVRVFLLSMRFDAGSLSADHVERVKQLARKDAMYPLTPSDLSCIWKARLLLKNIEEALPKVILAMPRNDLEAQMSLQYLLQIWTPVGLVSALGLLDARFPSHVVREYAVKHLDSISDSEIAEVLLQLVQALKFEPFHWSALAEFLLRRALASPFVIGQRLFWLLRSDMHVEGVSDRYGLLLTQYLWRCGGHAEQLDQEYSVVQSLLDVSNRLKDYPKESRFSGLQEMLSALKLPPSFTLPLSSTLRCSGLRIEKCGYMDSAKLPLKLVFHNEDPEGADICVFAKSGDDLRQDLLCLQILKIMDSLWRKNSLNLELSVYGCVTTGQECGFIEKVNAAHTISHIETAAGGASKAFAEDVLYSWLRSFHPTELQFEAAREKFWRSTAGYCVMSWVLGLGDRHNDNLMLTEQGRFLHIDFGHFLGNVKYFLGMNRDKAPFFFTKAMAFVIAGTTKDLFKSNSDLHEKAPEVFKTFVNHCLDAFIIVRNHHHLFINLFRMMLSCGMPELEHASDLDPLRDSFFIERSEAEARDEFRKLIHISMETQMTQFNNFVHNVVHAKRL